MAGPKATQRGQRVELPPYSQSNRTGEEHTGSRLSDSLVYAVGSRHPAVSKNCGLFQSWAFQ